MTLPRRLQGQSSTSSHHSRQLSEIPKNPKYCVLVGIKAPLLVLPREPNGLAHSQKTCFQESGGEQMRGRESRSDGPAPLSVHSLPVFPPAFEFPPHSSSRPLQRNHSPVGARSPRAEANGVFARDLSEVPRNAGTAATCPAPGPHLKSVVNSSLVTALLPVVVLNKDQPLRLAEGVPP
jgi:hypothetical protein